MKDDVRKLLFRPLSTGSLSVVVPNLTVELPGRTVSAPAHLTGGPDGFMFTLHFQESQPDLHLQVGRVFTEEDQITVRGQIAGELAFQCRVFPPVEGKKFGSGGSTVILEASRMELPPESFDRFTSSDLAAIFGKPVEAVDGRPRSFYAHIFHGPALKMHDAGTKTVTTNDFLGEATRSSKDTHMFTCEDYEGALIEEAEELHLHIRSKKNQPSKVKDPVKLVDLVTKTTAFIGGFHPWPTYREVRVDRRVVERWICPKLNLKQTYLAPVSTRLWLRESTELLGVIIPTVAAGLGSLSDGQQDHLDFLIWHLRSSELSDLPNSTKLLVLCAGLDGLMKLIAGYQMTPSSKKKAKQIWKEANDILQLSWEHWTAEIFDLWSKYRNSLAHGWLWIPEADDVAANFTDYPRLSCAFSIIVAAWCGYEGPIVANPMEEQFTEIKRLKNHYLPQEPRGD